MEILTRDNGSFVEVRDATNTLNTQLLDNEYLIEKMARFDRERVPERVVHAKGAGAFGYFEVTHDITKYCKASLFEKVGKRTPVAMRFSATVPERGGSDTARETRGIPIKFYTEEGIWDLTGNNVPIFFLRDPIFFSDFIHSIKRNPTTNLLDPNMQWDFITQRPETINLNLIIFGDRGIPDGFRHMHGFGIHTFEVVNDNDVTYYVKFHYLTNQGIKNLTSKRARELGGIDPDYAVRDLYDAIATGDHPSWTLYIQVMSLEEAKEAKFDPFDLTRVWPHSEYPLKPVGQIVLNRNPVNHFAEVEQLIFCPGNLVPGILGSPDAIFRTRRFSYRDTQIYRMGTNYQQLPVNSSPCSLVRNYNRDGFATLCNQKGAPNYFPNSFNGPVPYSDERGALPRPVVETPTYEDFSQSTIFYIRVLDDGARSRLIQNLVSSLRQVAPFLQERAVLLLSKVHSDLGHRVQQGLQREQTKL